MQDLINQEIFEMEVLEYLKNKKILNNLVFIGGTMLRLCHELPRYSTDLDFWLKKKTNISKFFLDIRDTLKEKYIITDSQNQFYTILFEIKSEKFPRKLKIEIRKKIGSFEFEQKIAFSKYTNIQVLLDALTLEETMKNKIKAFIERKQIRDCFDIEFLLRKGIKIKESKENLEKILRLIKKFKSSDYKVTLGSILEHNIRQFYIKKNFEFLISKINEIL